MARRVQELVDDGECAPGEVVLLFAAGTSAEAYEEALRERGSADPPSDGPRLLRPAAGRRPAGVPAAAPQPLRRRGSPYRACVAARRACRTTRSCCSGGRPAGGLSSAASSRSCRRPLRSATGAGSSAFRQRYERLARLSLAAGLERLCERIVAEHDYDLAVLARWDGRRRYANLQEARAAGAVVRGAARPRPRGIRPLRPRPGARRRTGGRGRLRGGRRRGRAAADHPRGEGPRVPGRRRVRRGARGRTGSAGRDPLPAGRPFRDPRRRSRRAASVSASSATTRCARPSERRRRPRHGASTTSR